ncbi:T-cell surface protein tactile [Pleuronectes platessa]|uniref:T-cell surface protein tactile n=1 Tax=Pleuronectes platessa TaxID=8262 RepID=UPI00232A2897|nr:T-cell surface protein tactile [Pleuronectes platessa]
MSLGILNVAGAALGAAFSLLACASIIQGFRHDGLRPRYDTREAVVGQNITLQCFLESLPELKIVNIEWTKKNKESTKLALFSPAHGIRLFWPNLTLHYDNSSKSMGSYLHLPEVNEWDSGTYICDITTFPYGTVRRETELKIKDVVEITCDTNSSLEVGNGQNVTIRCRASPDAQYRWTKNEELVSQNESLELSCVTDAHAGVYTLTVSTGNETVHKEFTITVQTATTHSETDPTAVSLQSYVTESFSVPSDTSSTTSPTTGLLTTDSNVTWTTANGSHGTPDSTTAGEDVTSFTSPTHSSVTTSPVTQTDPSPSATSSPGAAVFTSTQEVVSGGGGKYEDVFFVSTRPQGETSTSGKSTEQFERPGATPTLNTGNNGTGNKDAGRTHLVALIIIPVLVLIAVAGYLYRRRTIKQRMSLPPPFKPPPPPVKYSAATHHEMYRQAVPTSRCNSVAETGSNVY